MATCDICGRSEFEIQHQAQYSSQKIEIDEDGLWICGECKAGLTEVPLGNEYEGEQDDRIRELAGKSAGAICRTMDLPYTHPYRSIIDAASKIAYDEERYLSTWTFVEQWMDGTTLWLSADKSTRALVFPNGNVEFQANA